jgi:hypothetical protein
MVKHYFLIFLFIIPFISFAQVVEETIQIDSTFETIKVIYKPSVSTTHYTKKTAVFADDTTQVAIEKSTNKTGNSGLYKVFYPDGNIRIRTVYASNKLNGEWTYYDPKGVIKIKGNYETGIKDGYWAYKSLKIYGRYKDGLKNRKWYSVNSNNKKEKSTYKKGILTRGKGVGNEKIEIVPDTVYQKGDTTIVESKHTKYGNSVKISYHDYALDFLKNNAFLRKKIKTYFKKDIQKYKKNYKRDVFQFKVAENTPEIEIESFLKQSEAGEVEVAVIDYILKNKADSLKSSFNTTNILIEKEVVLKAQKESEITVYFSEVHYNLMRIDVVWTPIKEIKTKRTTFKVLLYFNEKGELKGAEYERP